MKFVAFERAKQGTGASRRLRISGRTPGIIYGGSGTPARYARPSMRDPTRHRNPRS